MSSSIRAAVVGGVGTVLLLGGCSIQHRPKTQFAGQLTSTDAACPKTQGTLIVQNDQIVFSPADATWTLQGKSLNGKVEVTKSRPSFDHKLYTTTFAATLSEDRATGLYTTPFCTYTVDLTRF